MKKKGAIIGILALVFISCLGLQGVYAWFTSRDTEINKFSAGTNDVEIEEEFPENEVVPGETLTKVISFENTGTVPCFVRAKYRFSSLEAEENTEIVFGSALWEKQDDGYYYYKNVLAPGETTESFILGVKIKSDSTFSSDFDLDVYTETVQSEDELTAEEAFLHLLR